MPEAAGAVYKRVILRVQAVLAVVVMAQIMTQPLLQLRQIQAVAVAVADMVRQVVTAVQADQA